MNPPPAPSQAQTDQEHLRLLSIFHIVMGCFGILGLLFLVVHAAIFLSVFGSASFSADAGEPFPAAIVPLVIAFYGIGFLFLVATIVCDFLAARFLKEQRHRTFLLVIAGIHCINMPLGTALGVFTIIVLSRPSVRSLFVERVPQ
jgi:hypothetical protein